METAFKNYKAASLDISFTTLIRCILHPNTVKPVFHLSVMSIARYRDNMQATICLFFNHRNLSLIIYYIIIIALVSGTIVATR